MLCLSQRALREAPLQRYKINLIHGIKKLKINSGNINDNFLKIIIFLRQQKENIFVKNDKNLSYRLQALGQGRPSLWLEGLRGMENPP